MELIENNSTPMQQYMSSANQDQLRAKLFDFLKRKPMSYTELSEAISIGRGTVSNFMNGKPAVYRTLALIEKFLKDN